MTDISTSSFFPGHRPAFWSPGIVQPARWHQLPAGGRIEVRSGGRPVLRADAIDASDLVGSSYRLVRGLSYIITKQNKID